jgi:ATP-dependent RNA helicase RhlE
MTRTKHGADKVVRVLERCGHKAAAIHGNKSQNARVRAITAFRDGDVRVLVASDIAARGLDIDGITHVVNFDVPHEAETYVHRIGRTGRAGASGTAVSFCDQEERSDLRAIERLIRKPVREADHPFLGKAPPPRSSDETRPPRPPRHGFNRQGHQGHQGRGQRAPRSEHQRQDHQPVRGESHARHPEQRDRRPAVKEGTPERTVAAGHEAQRPRNPRNQRTNHQRPKQFGGPRSH